MQFSAVTVVLAAMASAAAAQSTVTVYACSSGVASSTIASTGLSTVPTPTGSPIPYVTGAASLNGVSALGVVVAGGVALLL